MAWIPGEELIIRLWETLVEKGIGSLLKPGQIKREGRALLEVRKEELLVLAQAKKDAESILAGHKQIDSKFRLTQVTEDTINPDSSKVNNPNVLYIVDKVEAKKNYKAIMSEINVNKAIIFAEEAIINDKEEAPSDKCTDQSIDDDWLNMWQENAGNISSEDLQQLWGKILAGEIKSPGRYSLRTLQFIRCLSKNEAEKISQLAAYNIEGCIFKDIPINAKEKTFDYFLHMQDLGIIQGADSIGLSTAYSSSVTNKYIKTLTYKEKVIIITNNDAAKILTLPALPLTSLGKELLSLCEFQSNETYIQEVMRNILRQGFKVELSNQWVLVDSGKSIQYFNAREIKL